MGKAVRHKPKNYILRTGRQLHVPHASSQPAQHRDPGVKAKSFEEAHSHLLAAKLLLFNTPAFPNMCVMEMIMRETGRGGGLCSNVIRKALVEIPQERKKPVRHF